MTYRIAQVRLRQIVLKTDTPLQASCCVSPIAGGKVFSSWVKKYNPQRRKPDNLKTFSRSRVGIRAAQISPLAAGVGDPRIRI